MILALQIDTRIGHGVGLDRNRLFVLVPHGFVALAGSIQRVVVTRLKVAEVEYAVVVVVNRIFLNLHATLVQGNLGAVQRQPLVVHLRGVGVELVVNLLVLVLNQTEDITFLVFVRAEVVHYTTIVTIALHAAVIYVQSTVTGRLVGVEVTFEYTAYRTMFQYAVVAVVRFAVRARAVAAATHEAHVTTKRHVRCRIVAGIVIACRHRLEAVRPHGLAERLAILLKLRLGCIIATIEPDRIVSGRTLGGCVRVNGDKQVIVA